MKKLHVNFVDDPLAGRWARWVLFGLGALLVVDVSRGIVETHELLEQAQAHAGRTAPPVPVSVPADPEALERQTAAAQEIIERMAVPWSALFVELEGARTEDVSLLGIEPDAAKRTLVLAGEAKDLYTVVRYVAALKASTRLTDVHLTRHERRKDEAQGPIVFSVNARWAELQ